MIISSKYSLWDSPICSLKSLSNVAYGQTGDRSVEKYCELFFESYVLGIPMAHWT